MDWLWGAAGLLIVASVLLDMFQTLLHPRGNGWFSSRLRRGMWWASKQTRHPLGSATGPAAMVATILLWVALMVIGWALVYFPYVPDGFAYSPGIDPSRYSDVAEALYLSLVAVGTLGLGDVVGTGEWLRFAPPLEALTGFALLTAALTWFQQIEGPLKRRRTLALELHTLAASGAADGLATWDADAAHRTLQGLAVRLLEVRIDYVQHSEQFYFRDSDTELSLAVQLEHAVALRDAAQVSDEASVRAGGEQLRVALEDFAGVLVQQFVDADGEVDAALQAYRREHRQ